MLIQHFASLTGLSAHTLRYYEKIGLLRPVHRDGNGHRHFTEADVEWVQFIKRLKDTGMPLRDILSYAELRAAGSSTLATRRALLYAHAQQLEARLARDTAHLQRLQEKIAIYDQALSEPA